MQKKGQRNSNDEHNNIDNSFFLAQLHPWGQVTTTRSREINTSVQV
jgi:hypothetical protein